MHPTSNHSAADSEKSNKTQHGSERENEGGNNKEGDFLMLVSEIVKAMIGRRFSGDEKSVVMMLAQKTIGQDCKLRNIPLKDFISETEMSRRQTFNVLKELYQKGAVLREKRPGERGYYYGLSVEYFKRTNSGKIKNVYYLPPSKVHTSAPQRCTGVHFKGAQTCTQNPSKPAVVANSAKPSDLSSYLFSYLSGEIRNFVLTKSRNTQKRWIEIIKNIPSEDHNIFLAAVQIATTTNMDFLGNQIRSSVLCLFESTPWKTIREVFLTTLKLKKEEQEKNARREENERLVAESRRQSNQEAEARLGNVKFI